MRKTTLWTATLLLMGCAHQSPDVDLGKQNSTGQTQKQTSEVKRDKKSQTNSEKKSKTMLDVPLIKQNPELKYGCEVTSLTMMLQFAGVKVDKVTLAKKIAKDRDPAKIRQGDIKKWGDPNEGFVGDMTGKQKGYAVFDKPTVDLINHYLPGRAANLSGSSFEEVLQQIDRGAPVVVWTTGDYRLPDRWESWEHEGKTIRTPMDLHAVVMVGYDEKFVYLNDPLSGKKAVAVDKQQFIKSWKALKQRAVSYKPEKSA